MAQRNRNHRTLSGEQLEVRTLLTGIPALHSWPDAPNTLFLDFDGHVHKSFNPDFEFIHAPPFDLDGVPYDADARPSFSGLEQATIVGIWERVAEDFRPFDVNVTTVDPSIDDPGIFDREGEAARAVFTSKFDSGTGGTGRRWFTGTSSGHASLNGWYAPRDLPAWVFSTHAIGAGEIASHELGHLLGLEHHGDLSREGIFGEYRAPHGTGETRWSPIMGQGNVLTHWSDGSYPNASDPQQSDVGLLAVALGWRADDYSQITPLRESPTQTHVEIEGAIGNAGDSDTFQFEITTPGTRLAIDVTPWHNGPNLDVGISLFGLTQGVVVRDTDPTVNPQDRLAASLDIELEPGTYYLTIDGVGREAIPGDPGYSDYGSLGYYKIVGVFGEANERGDINQDGALSARDIDALHAAMRDNVSPTGEWSHLDLNGDAVLDPTDVDILVREVLATEYGDFNLDGQIDFTDFLTLASRFGKQGASWTTGDATGDGRVEFDDFLRLAANFGFQRNDA